MSWRIERWIPPRRDRDGNVIAEGRWIVFMPRVDSAAEAEKTIRRIAKHGGVAQATNDEGGMRASPVSFARWTGSGGFVE